MNCPLLRPLATTLLLSLAALSTATAASPGQANGRMCPDGTGPTSPARCPPPLSTLWR